MHSMLPIAYVSQIQMRRSLMGALATDPVVPERPRRPRHARATPSVSINRTDSPRHHAKKGAQVA